MRSGGVDDRIHYVDDEAVMDRGILEGANVKELANSIDTDHLFNELDEWILSRAKAFADDIYKQLREEYDAYTSEEYFIDLCDINGWRFDNNGNIVEE
jgi:isoleucyl-tRNA synthetase